MLEEVRRVIAVYEENYGMTSEEFLRQWEAGTAPDNDEPMIGLSCLTRLGGQGNAVQLTCIVSGQFESPLSRY